MDMYERLLEARMAANKTQQQVADLFEMTTQGVSQWETGATAPSRQKLAKLAQYYGVTLSWLLTGSGARSAPPSQESDVRPPAIAIPPAQDMTQDVEVLGTTVGGSGGDFELNGETIDRVRRPPALAGAKGVFALYVVGDSMAPRYEPGDLIFVHPGRVVTPGCDVLVELLGREGERNGPARIKRLVRRTATKLILEQFNPPKELTIPIGQVKNLFRILRSSDLFGV